MKLINLKLSFLLTIVLIILGCNSQNSQRNQTNPNTVSNPANSSELMIAKIKVTQKGEVFLNGNETSLDNLKKSLYELKKENGVVYYYRENPKDEPTTEAISVIQAIIDAKLPVRLSTKSDFSDSVNLEGKSHPQN